MFHKIRTILIHPVFIYGIIFILECVPYLTDKTVVLDELPKIGDNFKSPDGEMIYYYSGKGKYTYSSVTCYFSHGNPSFAANYKDGGIKTIQTEIAEKIPLLGDMCENVKVEVTPKKEIPFKKKYLSFNYLLDNFSQISHLMSYLILALSISYHFKSRRNRYWLAFAGCFLGGGLLELIQKFFIVGRTASLDDQLQNCIGAVIGIILFWLLRKFNFLKS